MKLRNTKTQLLFKSLFLQVFFLQVSFIFGPHRYIRVESNKLVLVCVQQPYTIDDWYTSVMHNSFEIVKVWIRGTRCFTKTTEIDRDQETKPVWIVISYLAWIIVVSRFHRKTRINTEKNCQYKKHRKN